MNKIEPILKKIDFFYKIFVGLFIVNGLAGFAYGIYKGIEMSKIKQIPVEVSTFAMIGKTVYSLFLFVVSVISIVYFIKLLVAIGRSIKRKNIFDKRTITLIRKYAVVYFLMWAVQIVGTSTGLSDIGELISEPLFYMMALSSLNSVIMLLLLGEVLKIGSILKEEQELTI